MRPISPHTPPPSPAGSSSRNTNTTDSSSQRSSSPSRSNLALGALPAQKSKAEYFAEWDAWANTAPPGTAMTHLEAVRRMKEWLNTNHPDEMLVLNGLRLHSLPNLPASIQSLDVCDNVLTSLPNLPASLQRLDVSDNQLTSLPNLPASLRRLDVRYNQLTSLPALPASLQLLDVRDNQLTSLPTLPASLQHLRAFNNRLTSLPDLPASLRNIDFESNRLTSLPNLPVSLQHLTASDNLLTSLPDLPASLEYLVAGNNRLTSLPESITALTRNCSVDLGFNPFSERVITHIRETLSAPGYSGPQIRFSMMPHASHNTSPRPLIDAVSDWHGEGERGAVKAKWKAFENEYGADAFSQFLDKLRTTVNFGNPEFKQSVAEWLSHLADRSPLRQNTFLIGLGATETCEDRVSLTFNEMKKARLAADVEDGQYDRRLPDLITLARGMFRLDKLENIAREKVESLQFVDEIEVYLAYQVKLREKLNLPLDTPDMRFFGVSWVTEDDLKKAETDVKAVEKEEFVHYLSTDWQPWQSVLKRLHGEQYEKAQDKLIDAMGDDFSTRLNARLKETGLEDDDDARRTVGPQVQAEIAREIKGQLTREFLKENIAQFDVQQMPGVLQNPEKLLDERDEATGVGGSAPSTSSAPIDGLAPSASSAPSDRRQRHALRRQRNESQATDMSPAETAAVLQDLRSDRSLRVNQLPSAASNTNNHPMRGREEGVRELILQSVIENQSSSTAGGLLGGNERSIDNVPLGSIQRAEAGAAALTSIAGAVLFSSLTSNAGNSPALEGQQQSAAVTGPGVRPAIEGSNARPAIE